VSLPTATEAILRVEGLSKHFPVRRGPLRRVAGQVRALDGVSFAVRPGEVFGLAGESGSGKSTLARIVVGLETATTGSVRIGNTEVGRQQGHRDFGKLVQMVFQNPGSSLNPRRSIHQTLALPLALHGTAGKALHSRTAELLEMVELPRSFRSKHPHELSGGQKQRVAIARALAVAPKLLVLDEPTSALDVSVQAKVIELLQQLRRELELTYLFISHDLSLMRSFADRVGVMYLGQLVEIGACDVILRDPSHPYTRGLLASVPVVTEAEAQIKAGFTRIEGEIPSAARIPGGCRFHTRCPLVEARCRNDEPVFTGKPERHAVRCHVNPVTDGGRMTDA
jgi:peptide/nickel transport system ATP-binding protein